MNVARRDLARVVAASLDQVMLGLMNADERQWVDAAGPARGAPMRDPGVPLSAGATQTSTSPGGVWVRVVGR